MKKIITILALAASLATSRAQSTLYWTWTGETPGDDGSGTLTADNIFGNFYLTAGADGTLDSDVVTGAVTETALYYPAANPFNGSLLELTTASDTFTFTYTGDSPNPELVTDGNTSNTDPGVFTLNPTPVPEPGTLALAGLGATVLLTFRRKK